VIYFESIFADWMVAGDDEIVGAADCAGDDEAVKADVGGVDKSV
jgi:hypothetical protein